MKAVLDEGVPKRLAMLLQSHGRDVSAFVPQWQGLQNGALLAAIRNADFECLLTCDRNLHHQQTIAASGIALIVLPAQRYDDLIQYLDSLLAALDVAAPGAVIVVPRTGYV